MARRFRRDTFPVPSGAPTGLEPLTQALLDSGNAAFRRRTTTPRSPSTTRRASRSRITPPLGSGRTWSRRRRSNTALADSALRMVRARAPELQQHPGRMPPGTAPAFTGAPPSHYSPHQRRRPQQERRRPPHVPERERRRHLAQARAAMHASRSRASLTLLGSRRRPHARHVPARHALPCRGVRK